MEKRHFILDITGIINCNAQALSNFGYVDKLRILDREPASLSPEFQLWGSPSNRFEGGATLARDLARHRQMSRDD